jgi:alpha/beta superfamily hydrolase
MISKLNIAPIANPLECCGYSKGQIRKEPEQEFNFFLYNTTVISSAPKKTRGGPCSNDHDVRLSNEMTEALACALILNSNGNKATSICPKTPMSKKQLSRKLHNIDKSKPIIIMCHGLLSWRNQMLISNLAMELSSSSEIEAHTLRFDFMASGHSPGIWKFANYEQDYRDLCQIVKFIQDDLQCKVACIVGHSQSAAAVIKYASAHDNSQYQNICYVNLAGRYLLPNDFNPDTIFDQEQCTQLTQQKYFDLIKSGESDMNRSFQFRQEDIDNRNAFDISTAANGIKRSHVLTIHGDADVTVPMQDAYKFEKAIRNHTLKILKGASHNFNGLRFMDDLVDTITTFISSFTKDL